MSCFTHFADIKDRTGSLIAAFKEAETCKDIIYLYCTHITILQYKFS